MAFKGWKIDEFHKGLNDYSDPKDISSDEFAEIQNCFIGKKGQLRSHGKFELSPSDVDNLVVTGGSIITGRGLHSLRNDYSFTTSDFSTTLAMTITHPTTGSSEGFSTATFQIEDLIALFDDQVTDGELKFRLKLVASDTTTTYLMPNTDASIIYDFGSSGDAEDDESASDNDTDRFDAPLKDEDGNEIEITFSGYGGVIIPKNTDAWQMTDNIQEDNAPAGFKIDFPDIFTNLTAGGTYTACGFMWVEWRDGPGTGGAFHSPYYNYTQDFSDADDDWDFDWEFYYWYEQEHIPCVYSRYAFAQWMVDAI